MIFSYSTRSIDHSGIKSSQVGRSGNETLISKDHALHKQLLPKISREVQIRKLNKRHKVFSSGSAKPEILAYVQSSTFEIANLAWSIFQLIPPDYNHGDKHSLPLYHIGYTEPRLFTTLDSSPARVTTCSRSPLALATALRLPLLTSTHTNT
jgi:hypothetical protein